MRESIERILGDRAGGIATRIVAIYAFLLAANLGAWAWALIAFAHRPLLLGTSLLAYGFGLRHAVDADHIAAIDNVTRRMMQDGRRPVAVGLFFSLGHSTVVVLASAALAFTATRFGTEFDTIESVGGAVGTLISSAFLLAIAAMNLVLLRATWRSFRTLRSGGRSVADDTLSLLGGGGILARLLRPCFSMMRRSWQLYPLGLLFGLGFDTATEIGLLGISATQASNGLPIWSILVFPALFTAAMSLIDTTDGVLMLGTYGWAFVRPARKLYYNMTITAASILVALLVGGIEALGLIAGQFSPPGPFWNGIGHLNDHSATIGLAVIGVFAASWIVSAAIWRARGYDRLGTDLG